MNNQQRAPQLERFQNILPDAVLLVAIVALSLSWLRPLVGARASLLFWRLSFEQDLPVAWVTLNFMLGLSALWVPLKLGRIALPSVHTLSEFVNRRILWLAVAALPLYAATAFFVCHRFPLAMDEYTVWFQSYVFASGHITGSVVPGMIDWVVPAEYQGHFLHVSHANGTWVSSFWPGFALLMAPFAWFDAPWLCNPVLTSASLWLVHRFTLKITDSLEAALWAVVFTFASPVIFINSGTYFSMPAHLCANLLFCYLLALGTRRSAFAAGWVSAFALLLHNPVPHAVFAFPWLVWMALRRRDLLGMVCIPYIVLALPAGLYWSTYLNHFDASRYVKALETTSPGTAHSPFLDIMARVRVAFNLPSIDIWIARWVGLCKVVLWAVPGLAVLAWYGTRETKKETFPRLLVASFWLTFAVFLFVPFLQGLGWGFRYLHPPWMALPIIGGIALARPPIGAAIGPISLRRYFAFSSVLSALVLIPLDAIHVGRFTGGYMRQIPSVPNAAASLTFIRVKMGDTRSSLVQNDPFLRGNNWKLVDHGDAPDAELARKTLVNARQAQKGEWGQIWIGDGRK